MNQKLTTFRHRPPARHIPASRQAFNLQHHLLHHTANHLPSPQPQAQGTPPEDSNEKKI